MTGNPRIEAAAHYLHVTRWMISEKEAFGVAKRTLEAADAVTTVEELLSTRAGLALANAAYGEGLSAGIQACNEAEDGKPFVKPESPYSAPLLAMIRESSVTAWCGVCCRPLRPGDHFCHSRPAAAE